jgi:hypothetical protein
MATETLTATERLAHERARVRVARRLLKDVGARWYAVYTAAIYDRSLEEEARTLGRRRRYWEREVDQARNTVAYWSPRAKAEAEEAKQARRPRPCAGTQA